MEMLQRHEGFRLNVVSIETSVKNVDAEARNRQTDEVVLAQQSVVRLRG